MHSSNLLTKSGNITSRHVLLDKHKFNGIFLTKMPLICVYPIKHALMLYSLT